MDTIAILAWCRQMARTLPSQEIRRQADAPYLTRYYAAGWNPDSRQPGAALYLHRFVSSDPLDQVHSHPWEFGLSLILVGSYREYRCTRGGRGSMRDFRPGDVNYFDPIDRHRIELLTPEVWTLFLAGNYLQPWGFHPAC